MTPDKLVLWLAQGLGVGRIPKAPGTFGSGMGLLWFALLLAPGSLACYLAGSLAGIALSVWCCGRAEKILGQTDPGSVVLDEIAAIPVCYSGWVLTLYGQRQGLPSPEHFFSAGTWLKTFGIFVLFRAFDIIKPWPIRQSQRLPGGWGVTVDDLLAAVFVSLVSILFV